MSFKFAQTSCCGKGMNLISIETMQKRECLKNDVLLGMRARLYILFNWNCVIRDTQTCIFSEADPKLGISLGTSFWTSGLQSNKCPNLFGWCNGKEKEFIDASLFDLGTGNKECVTVTMEKTVNKSSLVLQSESCSGKKRFICEVSVTSLELLLLSAYFFLIQFLEGICSKV